MKIKCIFWHIYLYYFWIGPTSQNSGAVCTCSVKHGLLRKYFSEFTGTVREAKNALYVPRFGGLERACIELIYFLIDILSQFEGSDRQLFFEKKKPNYTITF